MLPDISRLGGPQHVARNFDRNFWHKFRQQFQNSDLFFGKSPKLAISRGRFRTEGGAPGQKFFLIEFGLICRKKFFTSPNLWGASPALYKSILTHQHQFWRKMMILTWWSLILIQLWRAVSSQIIYRILPNRVSEHLGPSGSPLCCQNFLSKFPT